MRSPERRNRKIGTAASGCGQDNRMRVPQSWQDRFGEFTFYYERIEPTAKRSEVISGSHVTFCFENPRKGYSYGCSVDDGIHMLEMLADSVPELPPLIVFRQPTRKQNLMVPVWGRFIYDYEAINSGAEELNGEHSAIVLEAQRIGSLIRYPHKMSLEDRKEFERLCLDGHRFKNEKRYSETVLTETTIRNTILYRSLIHELGHWKQYCDNVIFEATALGPDWTTSWQLHHSQPVQDKEHFAHRFARENADRLVAAGMIPF